MSRAKLLFVDDQKSARDLFARRVDPSKYEALLASSVADAEEILRRDHPDVVITDLRMPETDGLAGLSRFHAIEADVPVILVTAFGSIETAVEAMRKGAFDYIRKPFEPEEMEIVVERALTHRNLVRENARLRSEVSLKFSRDNIIAESPAMRAVLDLVDKVALTDFAVIILGASGTGKDLIAKLIHYSSPRSKGPFITLNCSAIPEHLLESELFGYEKGAFSGASASKDGFLAKADGGTLFLDEIGDMSLSLQPKLLRVLQDQEFYPVGSRRLTRTDFRLISASNQRVRELVDEQKFREDLFYRINTVSITLPPLCDRREEIPSLVSHFLAKLGTDSGGPTLRVSAGAMRCLLEYPWPGNVRELEHALARASIVCDSDEIQCDDLAPEIRLEKAVAGHVDAQEYRDARREFERAYFTKLLAKTEGCVQKAAELAGIHRTTLYEKLGKLGIAFDKK